MSYIYIQYIYIHSIYIYTYWYSVLVFPRRFSPSSIPHLSFAWSREKSVTSCDQELFHAFNWSTFKAFVGPQIDLSIFSLNHSNVFFCTRFWPIHIIFPWNGYKDEVCPHFRTWIILITLNFVIIANWSTPPVGVLPVSWFVNKNPLIFLVQKLIIIRHRNTTLYYI